jgi:hypothetical protein
MDVHSEPDTDAHLSTTVPLSEEEASVEVVPTTTEEASSVSPGKVDPEKNGKLAALWTPALNDKQTDKLKQLVAFFVEAGLDPAAVIPETLAKWSNVSKALWKEYGDDFNVPKHPKPGYLLGHGPIIVDVLKKQSPPEVSSFW